MKCSLLCNPLIPLYPAPFHYALAAVVLPENSKHPCNPPEPCYLLPFALCPYNSAVVVLPEKPNRTVPTAVPSAESVGQATQTLADMSSLNVRSARGAAGASWGWEGL